MLKIGSDDNIHSSHVPNLSRVWFACGLWISTSPLGCHNKMSKNEWFKQQKFTFCYFHSLEVPHQSVHSFGFSCVLVLCLEDGHLLSVPSKGLCSAHTDLWCLSSYTDTRPIGLGPHLTTLFNLNYIFESPPPNMVTVEVRASTWDFWGNIIQSIMIYLHNFVTKARAVFWIPLLPKSNSKLSIFLAGKYFYQKTKTKITLHYILKK